MGKLTAIAIKNLRASDGKKYVDYLDGDGLKVRVFATGNKKYIYRYKMNNAAYEYTIGECSELSLVEARKRHTALRAKVKSGINPKIERDLEMMEAKAVPTIKEFSETFIERYAKPKNKAWAEQERMLKVDVTKHIGMLKIDAVKKSHIIALLDKKEDAGSPVARNRLLSLLARLMSYALERDVIQLNPTKGIKKLPEKAKDRHLTNEEIIYLWGVTGDDSNAKIENATKSIIRLALLTGQRIGEVCSIQAKDIHGDVWYMPDNKRDEPHTVPLAPMAKAIIDTVMTHNPKGLLFPDINGNVRKSQTISRAFERFKWILADGIQRPTPHSMRHTFTTGLERLDVSEKVQKILTNHADNSIHGKYTHHRYDDKKRQAMDLWERELHRILGGGEQSNVVQFRTA